MAAAVTYLNAIIGEAPIPAPGGPSPLVAAQAFVSRSGAVIETPSDYYCSVFRLTLSTATSIPLWIPALDLTVGDGLTTIYTVTVKYSNAGTVHYGRAALKLQKAAADVVLYTANQPNDDYCFVYSRQEFLSMWNTAATAAYEAAIQGVAPSPLVSGEGPYMFNEGTTDLFAINCYPYIWYVENSGSNQNYAQLFMNSASASILQGWRTYRATKAGRAPDPHGCDIRFVFDNDGRNWFPQPADASKGMSPNNTMSGAALVSLVTIQNAVTTFPSITNIRLLSSLPSASEAVPSPSGNGWASILTDFAPDLTQLGSQMLYYNAAMGDCRYVRLTGSAPITTISFRIESVDWQGIARQFYLGGPGEACTLKLAFVPRNMVEGTGFRS